MGPYGKENFKSLHLIQILLDIFKDSPNFYLNGPHKSTVWIFCEIFANLNFNYFFRSRFYFKLLWNVNPNAPHKKVLFFFIIL